MQVNTGISDPTDFRARERVRQERTDLARLKLEQEAGDFRWLMSVERGRRFMWLLLEQAGMDLSCFSPNAAEMGRMAGEREYGLRMQKLLRQHCPDLYVKMTEEQLCPQQAVPAGKR